MHAHGSSKQRPSAALTQRLGQLRMLPRLPAALKASLKLALQRSAVAQTDWLMPRAAHACHADGFRWPATASLTCT